MTCLNRHTLATQDAPLAPCSAMCAGSGTLQRTTRTRRVGSAPDRNQPSKTGPLLGLYKTGLPLRVSPLSNTRRGAHLKNWTPPHVLSLPEPESQDR